MAVPTLHDGSRVGRVCDGVVNVFSLEGRGGSVFSDTTRSRTDCFAFPLWVEQIRCEDRDETMPRFKARVALEALKGENTVPEIAKQFDVHPHQVTAWKNELLHRAGDVFGSRAPEGAADAEKVRELHAKIGELTERDLLAHALGLVPGPSGRE